MTTNHHTPIAEGSPANAATFNAPLEELDEAVEVVYFTPSGNEEEFLNGEKGFSVPAGTGGTNGHIIQSEGVDQTQRQKLDFKGPAVKVTNGVSATEVEITSREVLTADRTYYVSTTGNDENDGLTSGAAILTPQVAVDTILEKIDAAGYNINIQFADGEHTSGINIWGPGVGIKNLYLTGNVSSVSDCKITTSTSGCISVKSPLNVTISGFQLKTTGYHSEIYSSKNANVTLDKIIYDDCGYAQINANYAGRITLSEDYEVIGDAVTHIHCDTGGQIYGAVEATFTGTPNFSAFVIGVSFGNVYVAGMTWTGSVTGQRFLVHSNGCIYGTSSLSFIPGDSDGVEASGGKYIGDDTYPDALQVSPSWIAPSLINSWANLGAGFNEAGYFLDQFGMLHLRGMVAGGTPPSVAFVLPAGYRPTNSIYIAVASANLFGMIIINSSGNVNISVGNTAWVSLDGISFAID